MANVQLFPTDLNPTLPASGTPVSASASTSPAPFLATWLISLTGSSLSPALLFVVSAVVASLTVTTLKETAKMAHLKQTIEQP